MRHARPLGHFDPRRREPCRGDLRRTRSRQDGLAGLPVRAGGGLPGGACNGCAVRDGTRVRRLASVVRAHARQRRQFGASAARRPPDRVRDEPGAGTGQIPDRPCGAESAVRHRGTDPACLRGGRRAMAGSGVGASPRICCSPFVGGIGGPGVCRPQPRRRARGVARAQGRRSGESRCGGIAGGRADRAAGSHRSGSHPRRDPGQSVGNAGAVSRA